jgi:hypothetical protein
MQQAILFRDAFAAPSAGAGALAEDDVLQVVGMVREPLDVAAFRRAFYAVLWRYEPLRARPSWSEGDALRLVVDPPTHPRFEALDFRHLERAERERCFGDFLETDRRSGFDLELGPLCRLALFQLTPRLFRVVLTCHRMLLDSASLALVMGELFDRHDAYCEGREAALVDVRPSWDWAEQLEGAGREGDIRFWQERLAGFTAPTELRLRSRRPGPEVGAGVRAEHAVRLPEGATAVLRLLARDYGFGLDTVVLGAWSVLLSRRTRSGCVLFGLTESARASLPDGERRVGLLRHTMPFSATVLLDQPLIPWFRGLFEEQMALARFAHTPLAVVRRCSGIGLDAPLFGSEVVYDEVGLDARLKARGPEWSRRGFRVLDAPGCGVTITAHGGSELEVAAVYDVARLDEGAVGRVLEQLATLLVRIAANPSLCVGDLSMLSASERRRRLAELPRQPFNPAGVGSSPAAGGQPAGRQPDKGLSRVLNRLKSTVFRP